MVTLKTPSTPFVSQLASPTAEKPVVSGAFTVKEWIRGDRVVLEKNPDFWQASTVSLDGVEWISIPDDNTRMLKVKAGELDSAIFVPFSQVDALQKRSMPCRKTRTWWCTSTRRPAKTTC